MAEGLSAWRDKLRETLASGWMQAKWSASQPVYAVVSSAALWPVFEALAHGDPAKLFPSLMGVTSAVATNLVANQLQQWKGDPAVTPGDVAEWVRRESMANPAILAEINLINEKLDTIADARRSAGEERWSKLAERLTGELIMLGSLPRFEASISGVIVQSGDHGMSIGVLHSSGIVAQHLTVNVVGDRYEGAPAASVEDSRRIYLSVLAGSHGRLSLRGLDVGAGEASAEQPKLGLAEVYVDLETTTRLESEEPGGRPKRADVDLQKDRPLRALEAVTTHDRLVVLGDPGSGKSTLLSHLALCLA